MTASSRNSVFYQQFLQLIEDANPDGKTASTEPASDNVIPFPRSTT